MSFDRSDSCSVEPHRDSPLRALYREGLGYDATNAGGKTSGNFIPFRHRQGSTRSPDRGKDAPMTGDEKVRSEPTVLPSIRPRSLNDLLFLHCCQTVTFCTTDNPERPNGAIWNTFLRKDCCMVLHCPIELKFAGFPLGTIVPTSGYRGPNLRQLG